MRRVPCLLIGLLLAVSLHAADNLEDVLKRMDEVAPKFRGLSAAITSTKVTLVVDDHTSESGMIYFQKEKGGKGSKLLIEISKPGENAKTVLVRDGKAYISRLKIKQTEEYEIGDKKELVEQFYLLGFGGGGHELAKTYKVTLAPECSLDGAACVKLDLQPQGNMARNLKKVELWLSKETWLPLQQRFTEPSGDHWTARYTQLKAETQPDDRFRLNDKGFKRVHPGRD